MHKIIKILLWVFVPIFLVLFTSSAFIESQAVRIAEYIVDAILLVLIGIELFSSKKEK
ncbi:MAG: hypothetical protein IKK30_00350 [Clostridia bacterium]|nr:hypothetical protein [Clostridia bacterium]